MSTDKERGQVLLIVILLFAVALTVGFSFISRSITNLRTSKEEASSQRALSAAEAGIEELLKANTTVPLFTDSVSPNTTYTASSVSVSGSQLSLNGDNFIPKDEGTDIWLVTHNASGDPDFSTPWAPLGGNLTIYWGSSTDVCSSTPSLNTMSALEVTLISGSLASPILTRYAFDPCLARRSGNNFSASSPGGVIDGKSYSFSAALPIIVNGLVIRVVPLYAGNVFGVDAFPGLPSQGIIIDSTGDSGGTKRKINVFKGYPQLPIQYFSYGLFSP